MNDRIDEEIARAQPIGVEGGGEGAADAGADRTPAGVLTIAGARMNAEARASMAAARQIHLYATPYDLKKSNTVASLWFHPMMEDTGTLEPPLPEDVWWAQVQYWIQKDIVDAIVGLNRAAAAQLGGRNEDWVGTSPVKEIVSIRFSDGYITTESDADFVGAAPGGPADALPPGSFLTVFTQSVSSELYDVVQFTAKLVMDQRDIPALVDRLCKNKFHTLLRVAYRAVPPNRRMVGKVYGSEPTVSVVMDFETVMLGSVFRPLMPTAVCERFEINCPKREGEEEGG